MKRFLANGQAIRREIRRLFQLERGRRVALVAFVGKSAEAYLPRPQGLELVCWPHAPGTNAATVKKLLRMKVDVRFAQRLHMKVYWTESQGAIVASSNLSTNAYGTGRLHEAAALLSSSSVDIDALLTAVQPTTVTKAALAKLAKASTRPPTGPPGLSEQWTFDDWLRLGRRPSWRLSCHEGPGAAASRRLREAAKEEGTSRVIQHAFCRKGELSPEDFALLVNVGSGRRRKAVVTSWLFVHRVVPVARNDRQYLADWPFQAGQLHRDAACPPPPFALDRAFRKAVRATCTALGADARNEFSIERTSRPGKKLLAELEKQYRIASRS
jgi:hypothetical protein